jgi:Tfp pilus assembly pilus retraction ATPase PilT
LNHLLDMARESSPGMVRRLALALAYHVHQILLPQLSEPGLVPVREVLRGTRPVQEALAEARLHEIGELLRSGSTDGQRSRDLELERRVFAGDLSFDEAYRWCRHRRTFTMEKIFSKAVT